LLVGSKEDSKKKEGENRVREEGKGVERGKKRPDVKGENMRNGVK